MSNNVLYTNAGEYGNYRTGQVGPIVQGQAGVEMLFTVHDLAGEAVDLTGYTITGKLRHISSQTIAALVGATEVTGNAAAGEVSWTTGADDIGESGEYALWFRATRAGYPTYITFPTPLLVVEDDDVSGAFSANLVGVTVEQANWLAATVAATQAGAEDHIVTIGGDGQLQDGGAAIAELVAVAGDTMTGALQFTGASHVGLVVLSLTTAQRDAVGSPATGALIWNSTDGEIQTYNGAAWVSVAGGHNHDGDYLRVANNLSDLDDAAAARAALDVDQAGADNSTPVTLAGTPDYITIAGQEITRNQIDLTTDVSGALPVTGGGTGAGSAADARTNLGLAAGGAGDIWVEKAGDAMSGELNMADNLVSRPKLKDYGETLYAAGDTGGGTVTVNLENGNVWSGTVSTSTTTFAFSNWPASGTAGSVTMIITNGGSQTVLWPAAVLWPGGSEPALQAAGVDILTFISPDAGTTIYGFPAGLNMS